MFAMIVTPAAAAYQWSYKINVILYLAVFFGAVSSFIGLFLSYVLDMPSGSTIVITISAIFVISMFFSPKRRSGKSIGFEHNKTCATCLKADEKAQCTFCSEREGKEQDHEHDHDQDHE